MEKRFIDAPAITIVQDTCNKCGLCSKICPIRVFNFKKGEIPGIQNNDECVLCGQCLCACPTNSINHSGFDKSNFKSFNNSQSLNADYAFDLLTRRRSLRNYKRDIPSIELLTKIVEIAGYAPSSPHHRVGWIRNATIVVGHENMKVVTEMTSEYIVKMIKMLESWYIKLAAKYDDKAKAALGVIPSFKLALNEYKNGNNMITYNAPAAIFLHAPIKSSTPQIDCDAACLQVQLFAEANGLGTCWNGFLQGAASGEHLKGFRKMEKFLKIPDGHKCYAAMTIGFPSVKLHSIPERKTDITWIIN
jgi:NAD-dependent dihydropyrimidine dehydrogenase PreA subunit/nitroreductase